MAKDNGKSDDWIEMAKEMDAGSDRAAAVLGGAFLDEQLKQLLESLLVEDKKLSEALFSPGGALGSFSSRTKMAYALGLLSPEIYKDIDTIRKIRNDFAHLLHGISFNSDSIKTRCQNLAIPKLAIPAYKKNPDPRSAYTMAVIFIIQYFMQKQATLTQNRFNVPNDSSLIAYKVLDREEE